MIANDYTKKYYLKLYREVYIKSRYIAMLMICLNNKKFENPGNITKMTVTPGPSAPVRCAPVAFPINKFAEIASPTPNYASPLNKWITFLPR